MPETGFISRRGLRRKATASVPKATTAGAPKTLPKVFQHEAIMQLLGKGSSNGSITGTEIARGLAMQPRFILLDEPFASVDRMCRADLLSRIGDRIRRSAGRGVAAIVTHDPAVAQRRASPVERAVEVHADSGELERPVEGWRSVP